MMYLGKDPIGLATSIPEFGNIAKIEIGEYTPLTDVVASETQIQHSLGIVPDFILYYCNEFTTSDQYIDTYIMSGFCTKTNFTNNENVTGTGCIFKSNPGKISLAYSPITNDPSSFSTSSVFYLCYKLTTDKLKAGITYHYILGKFKEVTPNANE